MPMSPEAEAIRKEELAKLATHDPKDKRPAWMRDMVLCRDCETLVYRREHTPASCRMRERNRYGATPPGGGEEP